MPCILRLAGGSYRFCADKAARREALQLQMFAAVQPKPEINHLVSP
jgi:hypothetical protein